MSDVDQTLEAQRDEIARLRDETARLRGALAEARRALRPKRESTFQLPDGIQIAYAHFVDLDAVFTMPVYKPGRYTLHDKAPAELAVDPEAVPAHFGLALKKPQYDGGGSSIGWLIQRIECATEGTILRLGRPDNPLRTFAGRRLIEGDDLTIPIAVPWGLAFQILVEVDRPADLRVIISGLRRI